jgi:hypothetical protein
MMPNTMEPTMYQTPGIAKPIDSSELSASMRSMLVGVHRLGDGA